jgi:N-acetylmuramoyl-L-alanine amidase
MKRGQPKLALDSVAVQNEYGWTMCGWFVRLTPLIQLGNFADSVRLQKTRQQMTLHLRGKCSWFGGPNDEGVAPDEGLAFIAEVEQQPALFLSYQPQGTTGLARRLNPDVFYIACRWDYDETPAFMLLEEMALVKAPKTGRQLKAYPADWGPHEDTGRVADISPGLMAALSIQTDDEVEVIFPFTSRTTTPAYKSIVISSGHGKFVRGASGILDEVDEARKVVKQVAKVLRRHGVNVKTFHDDASKDQSTNLSTIVNYHNAQKRQLDVSVHFNAYVETTSPMGTECLYVTQSSLAGHMAAAIADCGFINRGAKKRTDLYFLNQTFEPAILIEVCFVDSSADADVYKSEFELICSSIARVLSGKEALVA